MYPSALTALGVWGNAYILGGKVTDVENRLSSRIKEVDSDLKIVNSELKILNSDLKMVNRDLKMVKDEIKNLTAR